MNRLLNILLLSLALLGWSCKHAPIADEEPSSNKLQLGIEGYDVSIDVKSAGRADDISIFSGEKLALYAVGYKTGSAIAWPSVDSYLINTQSATVVTTDGANKGEIKYYTDSPIVFPGSRVAVYGFFPSTSSSGVTITERDNSSPKVEVTLKAKAAEQYDIMRGFVADVPRGDLNMAGTKYAKLTFDHTLAMLKVKVKASVDVQANQSLTQITATTASKAVMDDIKTMTYASHTDAVEMTLYDNSTGVQVSTTETEIPSQLMLFPEPSKITHFNVTIEGQTYKVAVPKTFELKAAQINTITLSVNKLGVRFDSFEIAKWETGSTQSENTTVEPFTTQFKVKLTNDFAGTPFNESGAYTASVKIDDTFWLEGTDNSNKIPCDLSDDGYLTFKQRISTLMLNDNPIALTELKIYKDGAEKPIFEAKVSDKTPKLIISSDDKGNVIIGSQTEPIVLNMKFSGMGNGTKDFPYEITNAHQLASLVDATSASAVNAIYCEQLNDIDLGGYLAIDANGNTVSPTESQIGDANGWMPIGTNAKPFYGVYNGNGKKITNLNINRGFASTHQGLFGCISRPLDVGYLVNEVIVDGYVAGGSFTGALIGLAKGEGVISNCTVNALVLPANDATGGNTIAVGGVLGASIGQEADSSAVAATIKVVTYQCSRNMERAGAQASSGNSIGGIVGLIHGNTTLTNSYNKSSGTMRLKASAVGGVVGRIGITVPAGVVLMNVSNSAPISVSGGIAIGGVVGYSQNGEIKINQAVNSGAITTSSNRVGGIIGYAYNVSTNATNLFEVNECRNNAAVSGVNYVGGVIGSSARVSNTSTTQSIKHVIRECVNNGKITSSDDFTGGILACFTYADPLIERCQNNGAIVATSSSFSSLKIGGIVGGSDQTRPVQVLKSINTGDILAQTSGSSAYSTAAMGGIVGVLSPWSRTGDLLENKIIECVNTGNLTSNSVNPGGILGATRSGNQLTLSDCYNTGNIQNKNTNSSALAAGIVSSPMYNCEVSNCYNAGTVTATKASGISMTLSATLTVNNSYTHTAATADTKATVFDMTLTEAVTKLNNTRSLWTSKAGTNNGMPILMWQ